MSQWTSEYAIYRDLSVAQGRVPVAIKGTVGAGDKPPSLEITEETEEEYFKHCSGDADISAGPDLGLIKQMLDMVRDINVSTEDEDCSNKKIIVTKLNAQCSENVPKNNTDTPLDLSPNKQIEQVQVEKSPKKRQRNIAVESILQAIADNEQNKSVIVLPEPMKLLRPNDFIANNTTESDDTNAHIKVNQNEQSGNINKTNDQSKLVTETIEDSTAIRNDDTSKNPTAVEKVNGWFKTQTNSPFMKKTSKVTLQATNMFKKKTIDKAKNVESKVQQKASPASSNNSSEYQPSTLASEYYAKYATQSKFRESIKDDIWVRAERKMKEIDEKRKMEMTKSLESTTSDASENGEQKAEDMQSLRNFMRNVSSAKIERCLNIVGLPQHRHSLSGECIVCDVITKKLRKPDQDTEKLTDNDSDHKTEDL